MMRRRLLLRRQSAASPNLLLDHVFIFQWWWQVLCWKYFSFGFCYRTQPLLQSPGTSFPVSTTQSHDQNYLLTIHVQADSINIHTMYWTVDAALTIWWELNQTIYLPSAVGLHGVRTRKGLSKVKILPFLQHLIPPPTEDLLKNSKNWIDKRSAPKSKVRTKSRSRKALAGTGMCKQPPVGTRTGTQNPKVYLEPRTRQKVD